MSSAPQTINGFMVSPHLADKLRRIEPQLRRLIEVNKDSYATVAGKLWTTAATVRRYALILGIGEFAKPVPVSTPPPVVVPVPAIRRALPIAANSPTL